MPGGTLANLKILLGLDASGVTRGAAQANRSVSGLGKSVGHLQGRISGLAGAAGLIGLGGGLVALTGFLKGSIDAATEFGTTVERLHQITGLEVGDVSQLSDAMDYFGISASTQTKTLGMLEKNLGTLTKTQASATKFQKDYGLSLVDSNGKAKDATTLLEDTAAFWQNTGIPQQTKIAALNKLYGRSWQDMIPFLSQGKKGIEDAINAGIRLTPAQIAANAKLRESQRAWNDSIGDLKVMVGNIFIPELSNMADAAAKFVNSHQADITEWFKKGLAMAKDFAGFVANTVIPTVRDLGAKAIGFWNGLPGPLKDLLIKGIVAEKAISFLFGFSITDVAKDAFRGAIKGLAGSFFEKGGNPANPLFVADVAGGLGGGGVAGAGGGILSGLKSGKGVLGMVGIAGAVAIAGASIAALATQFGTFMSTNAAAQKDLQGKADAAALQTSQEALTHLGQMTTHLNGIQGIDRMLLDTMGSHETETALINLGHDVSGDLSLTKSGITSAIRTLQGAQAAAISHGWTASAASIGNDIAILTARIPSASAIGAAVGSVLPAAYFAGGGYERHSGRDDPTTGIGARNRHGNGGGVYHDRGPGRGGGRASGGYVGPTWSGDVGERGRERLTMFPGGGGYVTANAGRGGGGGTVHVHFHGPVYGGKAALRQLAKDLEEAIRISRRDRRLVGDTA